MEEIIITPYKEIHGMEDIAASEYYHQRLKDDYLVQQLQHYNIELSV